MLHFCGVTVRRRQNVCFWLTACLECICLNKAQAVQRYVQNCLSVIILPVALYGCEPWFIKLKDEHGRKVFENRTLRKIFRSKQDAVTGGRRILRIEELYDLYFSPDITRVIKWRRVILKYIFKNWDGIWNGQMWLRTGTGFCESGNKPLSSIKCGEFPDKLRTCQLLKKDSDQWS
jgi:hypothetical protein